MSNANYKLSMKHNYIIITLCLVRSMYLQRKERMFVYGGYSILLCLWFIWFIWFMVHGPWCSKV